MQTCAALPAYRKRDAHQSPLWRILVDHREMFLRQYERRFEHSHGFLPSRSEDSLEKILRCGDPQYGLSLLHCPDCKTHLAVPFSCKERACPSCANRRAEDVSHRLMERLPGVGYRHMVITIPKMMGMRKRLQQDTRLYRHIARLLHRLLSRWMPNQIRCHRNRRDQKDYALPGIIMAVQTFGSGLKTHPHFHLLVTDGAFFPNDGGFYAMGAWDTNALTEAIRLRIVQSFVAREILREETAKTLLSLPVERSGFSVFVGESLNLPEEQTDIRRILQYILRPTLPLKHLHYEEVTGNVQYRDPRGPWKRWDHAVDFLADFVQHIPRARQHQVTYAGYFANALGNLKEPKAEKNPGSENSGSPSVTLAGPRSCCAPGQSTPSRAGSVAKPWSAREPSSSAKS